MYLHFKIEMVKGTSNYSYCDVVRHYWKRLFRSQTTKLYNIQLHLSFKYMAHFYEECQYF